jgi:hypothetical protein
MHSFIKFESWQDMMQVIFVGIWSLSSSPIISFAQPTAAGLSVSESFSNRIFNDWISKSKSLYFPNIL